MQISLFNKMKPTKKEKISKAQQSTLLIVGFTSVVAGAGIVMIINLSQYISFDNKVIAAKDKAAKNYSIVIKESGACNATKNSNGVYSINELNGCIPSDTDYKEVPNTLRGNILSDIASNIGFESVARTSIDACINPKTNTQYSHDELEEMYEYAKTSNDKRKILETIRSCSALRVASDALPNGENKEALLSSLDNIYNLSELRPLSLAPASSQTVVNSSAKYFSTPVSLGMPKDASLQEVMNFLDNLNKSIRYFSITSLSYNVNNSEISASAEAYYVGDIDNSEKTETLKLKDGK